MKSLFKWSEEGGVYKMVLLFATMGMLLVGCLAAQQAAVLTLNTSVVLNNYDQVKESIKGLESKGKFSPDEQTIIHSAETVFASVYAELMDPSTQVTYQQLYEANIAIVDIYNAIKKVVTDHWADFSAIDQARMKDFDKRLSSVYSELEKARDSEDAKAVYNATGQYLELLSMVSKIGLASM